MGRDTTGKTTKAGGTMSKTLKDLALELGYDEKALDDSISPTGTMLILDERYGVLHDSKGLHLTDLVSWAKFSPITIGRKSNATAKGLQFQIAQFLIYKKQIGG
jgi:hypothetical protein